MIVTNLYCNFQTINVIISPLTPPSSPTTMTKMLLFVQKVLEAYVIYRFVLRFYFVIIIMPLVRKVVVTSIIILFLSSLLSSHFVVKRILKYHSFQRNIQRKLIIEWNDKNCDSRFSNESSEVNQSTDIKILNQ